MDATSLGKIAVPVPGTPVRLSTDETITCARIRVEVVIGEVGRVFLGLAGMNKATGAGVIKQFWPTGAGGGVADFILLENGVFQLSEYYLDANEVGEGAIVSYWVQ